MVYVQTKPVNLSDPWLMEWSEPITIVEQVHQQSAV